MGKKSINHFSCADLLLSYSWGILLIAILSLSKFNIKACPSSVGLGGLTISLLLKYTFTGIPELAILYLSINLVSNCFDTKKYSSKYIFSLHFFKVGLLMIEFTPKSFPRPKEMSMVLFGILVTCFLCNQ